MADITDTSVYEYPDKVLVEVIGSDEYGEVAAITYPFSYDDDARDEVSANQPIEDGHLDLAKEALAERGYRVTVTEA